MRAIKPHILPYLFVALLATSASIPLFSGRFLSGHDAMLYPPRAVVFQKGLAEGKLLPRWTQDFAGGYGEPYFNFVAPLLEYLIYLLRLSGLGLASSQNYACFAVLLGSGLAMYLLASSVFGKAGGLAAAAAYIYAPYVLLDLYVRASYAELSGFPFPPLILWALKRLAETRRSQYLVMTGLAYALLLLCNNPSSLMFTLAVGLFVVMQSWWKKSFDFLLKGSAALGLGLMLSAFFWLPSLFEKTLVHTANLLRGFLNYNNHFVYLGQMLWSQWGYGLSVPGPNDGMSFQIGPVHLLAILASLILVLMCGSHITRERRSWIVFSLVVSGIGVFLALPISTPVWDRFTDLQYFQFPWRFLALVALGSSFLCAAPLAFVRGRALSAGLAFAIVAATVGLGFEHAKPEKFLEVDENYFAAENIVSSKLEVTTVKEYRPQWAEVDPGAAPGATIVVLRGAVQFSERSSSSTKHSFLAEAAEDSDLRLNIHYFPGWRVSLDSQPVLVTPSGGYGLMEFSIPKGSHTVTAEFGNTPVRTLAEIMTVLGAVVMLMLVASLFRGRPVRVSNEYADLI